MMLTESRVTLAQVRQTSAMNRRSRRASTLHHFLELAHKGHKSGKVHIGSRRLYRHGHSHHPRGFHDFQNLQWDPSIYRGKTFKDFRLKNQPPYSTVENTNQYCRPDWKRQTSLEESTAIKLKKPATIYKMGGIYRPTTEDVIFDQKYGSRRQQTLSEKEQWSAFLIEQIDIPEYKTRPTQMDHLRDHSSLYAQLSGYPKDVTVAVGPSKAVQVNFGYVGPTSGDNPLPPVITTLGSKVLEQSLLETTEELELQQIQLHIRKYLSKRISRQARDAKLIENEYFKMERRMAEKRVVDEEMAQEEDAEVHLGAILFSSQMCKRTFDETFDILQRQSLLHDAFKDLLSTFEPWCNREVSRFVRVPRNILDEIIENANILRIKTEAAGTPAVPEMVPTTGKFQNPVMEPISRTTVLYVNKNVPSKRKTGTGNESEIRKSSTIRKTVAENEPGTRKTSRIRKTVAGNEPESRKSSKIRKTVAENEPGARKSSRSRKTTAGNEPESRKSIRHRKTVAENEPRTRKSSRSRKTTAGNESGTGKSSRHRKTVAGNEPPAEKSSHSRKTRTRKTVHKKMSPTLEKSEGS